MHGHPPLASDVEVDRFAEVLARRSLAHPKTAAVKQADGVWDNIGQWGNNIGQWAVKNPGLAGAAAGGLGGGAFGLVSGARRGRPLRSALTGALAGAATVGLGGLGYQAVRGDFDRGTKPGEPYPTRDVAGSGGQTSIADFGKMSPAHRAAYLADPANAQFTQMMKQKGYDLTSSGLDQFLADKVTETQPSPSDNMLNTVIGNARHYAPVTTHVTGPLAAGSYAANVANRWVRQVKPEKWTNLEKLRQTFDAASENPKLDPAQQAALSRLGGIPGMRPSKPGPTGDPLAELLASQPRRPTGGPLEVPNVTYPTRHLTPKAEQWLNNPLHADKELPAHIQEFKPTTGTVNLPGETLGKLKARSFNQAAAESGIKPTPTVGYRPWFGGPNNHTVAPRELPWKTMLGAGIGADAIWDIFGRSLQGNANRWMAEKEMQYSAGRPTGQPAATLPPRVNKFE